MKDFWKEQLGIEHTLAKDCFKEVEEPWQALPKIKEWVLSLQENLSEDYEQIEPGIFVHKSCKIYPTATLIAPLILGKNTEVRPGAFLRGNIIVGDNCVVGNSTELKNVILFDNVQVPHYNYVGDSILGYKSHMGAGSITSNVKSDKTLIVLHDLGVETGLKKMGAVLGHDVEIGCNSVLNPGTIVLSNSNVYPLSSVRGLVEANSIYKGKGEIVSKY